MNEQLAAEKFRAAGLQKQVFAAIAAECAGAGNVLRFEENLTPVQVRDLCDAISQVCGGVAAVFSGSDEAGYSYCLMERGGDLRSFNKAMTAVLCGRGGGKPEYQQGSVKAEKTAIEVFFKENWA
jgi:alanyl-tRNA synthetase